MQLRFDIDPVSKDWVLRSLGRKWKDWKAKLKSAHYCPHETDEERLADRDERVLPDQWASLIAHWSSETEEVFFRMTADYCIYVYKGFFTRHKKQKEKSGIMFSIYLFIFKLVKFSLHRDWPV